MINYTLLVFTDGRTSLLEETLESFLAAVSTRPSRVVVHDDSGDRRNNRAVALILSRFGLHAQILTPEKRRGFAGAVKATWDEIEPRDDEWIFHLEDDFLFQSEVDIEAMAEVLDANCHLHQMALVRQPWNDEEHEAGSLQRRWAHAISQKSDGAHTWMEQRAYFTTNPSLYRASLTTEGWPQEARSEGLFSLKLTESDPLVAFGLWGGMEDPPAVIHIGEHRAGTGY